MSLQPGWVKELPVDYDVYLGRDTDPEALRQIHLYQVMWTGLDWSPLAWTGLCYSGLVLEPVEADVEVMWTSQKQIWTQQSDSGFNWFGLICTGLNHFELVWTGTFQSEVTCTDVKFWLILDLVWPDGISWLDCSWTGLTPGLEFPGLVFHFSGLVLKLISNLSDSWWSEQVWTRVLQNQTPGHCVVMETVFSGLSHFRNKNKFSVFLFLFLSCCSFNVMRNKNILFSFMTKQKCKISDLCLFESFLDPLIIKTWKSVFKEPNHLDEIRVYLILMHLLNPD